MTSFLFPGRLRGLPPSNPCIPPNDARAPRLAVAVAVHLPRAVLPEAPPGAAARWLAVRGCHSGAFSPAAAQLGRRKRRPGPAEPLQSSRLLCPGSTAPSAAPRSPRGSRAPADATRIPGATATPVPQLPRTLRRCL